MPTIKLPATVKGRFESGTVTDLTAEQAASIIRDTVENAVREGARNALKQYNVHVAKKRGLLRTKLKKMIIDQIVFSGDTDTIEVVFDDSVMDDLPYAEFHIDGKPHHKGDISTYEHPHTPGTRPIQKIELMEQVKREAWSETRKELKAVGFEVIG